MKLPNGDRAVVPEFKLRDFLPNEEHPVRPGHAVFFQRLLGVTRSNAHLLRGALLRAAVEGDTAPGQYSPYGIKHEVRFTMTGPRRNYTILSVWIIEHGADAPRLVTAFIE